MQSPIKLSAASMTTLRWAGGTSTELYIFPLGASYQARNFQFRISTATIEIAKSNFTSLPDTDRTLLILKGSILLHHKGKDAVKLVAGDQTHFSGDWETSCEGMATDFNLMCRKGAKGKIDYFSMEPTMKMSLATEKHVQQEVYCFYVYSGSFLVEEVKIEKGDCLVFNNHTIYPSRIECLEQGGLIKTTIKVS